MSKDKKRSKYRKEQSYKHRSQGVCLVAYNLEGRPVPDNLANEMADAVSNIAAREGFVVSVTRS